MRFFGDFFVGLASIMSFGWPRKGSYIENSPRKGLSADWENVNAGMKTALYKYKTEKNNDKA